MFYHYESSVQSFRKKMRSNGINTSDYFRGQRTYLWDAYKFTIIMRNTPLVLLQRTSLFIRSKFYFFLIVMENMNPTSYTLEHDFCLVWTASVCNVATAIKSGRKIVQWKIFHFYCIYWFSTHAFFVLKTISTTGKLERTLYPRFSSCRK